jgi:hypothetical protein
LFSCLSCCVLYFSFSFRWLELGWRMWKSKDVGLFWSSIFLSP